MGHSLPRMRFLIPIADHAALAAIAAHGFVDATRPPVQLLVYSVVALPLPGRVTTSAFCAASIVHFARDPIGLLGSVLLHALLLAEANNGVEQSVTTLILYFMVVHIPYLALRLLIVGFAGAVWVAMVAGVLLYRLRWPPVSCGLYEFSEKHQLVVVAHVLLDLFFPRF